jgi:hypothetical protein
LQLSEALRAHPEIKMRMDVNSGPVREMPDVNQRTNVAGAGINMAQRVMDCGDAGHTSCSGNAFQTISPIPVTGNLVVTATTTIQLLPK